MILQVTPFERFCEIGVYRDVPNRMKGSIVDARYAFERSTRFAEMAEESLEKARTTSAPELDLQIAAAQAAVATAFGTIATASLTIWPDGTT